MQYIEGPIRITRSGKGFIEYEGENDIRISSENLGTAFNGDTVVVSLNGSPKVEKVLERIKTKFTGTTDKDGKNWYVIPDDKRIHVDFFVSKKFSKDLKENQKVLVELHKWESVEKNPEVKILQIVGEKGEHEAEMRSILLNVGVDLNFPSNVQKEAEKINKKISKEEIGKRLDLRKTTTFTIDPFDAKDFDDAISFKNLENENIEIGIHIADVSHYVRPRTALDKEARERGFSVYLVDRTIPMLPEVLSNDVCSLNPNEDKLAFSAIFEFDKEGRRVKSWFGKTIINSNKRFTYEEAQKVLDAGQGLFYEELKTLNDLAKKMHKGRVGRGSILFDRDEVKIELDNTGKPIKIYTKKRKDTHKLVEEFMLLANREVTEHIEKHCKKKDIEDMFVYRIHDLPDEERIAELSIFLKSLGLNLDVSDGVDPKEINRLIKEVEGRPEEELVKTSLIRSMAKAKYSTKNIGHFGLAFKFYTHFTSPIRRYPDLLVHRLLERHLDDKRVSRKELAMYQKIAESSSEKEINAARAERDSRKYKQVEYMSEKIGETFEGIISGVTDWGLYVQEVQTRSEGLVGLSSMKDDFYRATSKYAIEGQKKKKKFRLGDKVKIKLIRADLDQRQLDFVFAD